MDFPTFSKLCLQCCANNRILKDVLKFYNCMMPSSYPLLHIPQCRTIAYCLYEPWSNNLPCLPCDTQPYMPDNAYGHSHRFRHSCCTHYIQAVRKIKKDSHFTERKAQMEISLIPVWLKSKQLFSNGILHGTVHQWIFLFPDAHPRLHCSRQSVRF